MLRRTLLISLLAFSLALNLATVLTLSFSWWKGHAQAADVTVMQKPLTTFLQEDLNLDKARVAEVLKMIDDKRPRVEQLGSLLESSRADMMDLFSAPKLDLGAVNDKLAAINLIQGEIRYETIHTIVRVSESLPADAKQRFGAYLQARACACAALGAGFGKGPCRGCRDGH